jgi:hypothetical protein
MYANTIKPSQFARLDSVWLAMESSEHAQSWVTGMVSLIGSDSYFRWHDSGDLQGIHHLTLIVLVARATPNCKHWLPTREYAMVKEWIRVFGSLPENLTIRLSAMYPDQPVKIPASLQGIAGITASNVHSKGQPVHGQACHAPSQNGECRDCRVCWSDTVVSYALH